MLRQLKISNFAIIDNLEIDFGKGFTTITGETGAGKSIMMGALSLILGEKADFKAARNAEKKSVVEAVFDINEYGLRQLFEDNDIDYFGDECIMRREISASGRSRAFINDTPVTLQVMRNISIRLIDIHSQHSNLLLSKHSYQLSVLDSMIDDKSILTRYSAEYKKYKQLNERLSKLRELNARRKAEEDYLRFQLSQLEELKLTDNEDEELEAEEKKLSNVNEIKTALWSAEELLSGEERSIISDMATATQNLSRVEDMLEDVGDLSERMHSLIIELKDISRTISSLQSGLVDNPAELERIQDRLNAIYSLEDKHKAASVNELLALQHDIERQLSEIDNSDEEISVLEQDLKHQTAVATALAEELSAKRREAALRFSKLLMQSAIPLGMKNLQFKVEFDNVALCHDGIDSVSFLSSFNKQQELMPVEASASGGEISRLMLCIKSIIARNMKLPTIIFDEVDTGVSGDVANRMGEMMRDISQKIQVITITHLPQVAVKGNDHFKVFKQDYGNSTHTSIKRLSADERVMEVAAMLSGEKIDDAALNNAKSLLGIS